MAACTALFSDYIVCLATASSINVHLDIQDVFEVVLKSLTLENRTVAPNANGCSSFLIQTKTLTSSVFTFLSTGEWDLNNIESSLSKRIEVASVYFPWYRKISPRPILFIFLVSCNLSCSSAQTWIRAGYWYTGSDSCIPEINSALFTHLICSSADVNSSTYQLSIPSAHEQYFSSFTDIVKHKNPSITTLLSIWDGEAATTRQILGQRANFSVLSTMLEVPSNRKSFVESSIKVARRYGFQGIDLLWPWLNTASDMINMEMLLDEWQAAVTSEARNSGLSRLILTMAVRYIPTFESLFYNPVESMKRNLDWYILTFAND